MGRKIEAISGGKIKLEDDIEEIYERKIVPYGNGANVLAPKRHIGKRVMMIILKD